MSRRGIDDIEKEAKDSPDEPSSKCLLYAQCSGNAWVLFEEQCSFRVMNSIVGVA